MKIYGHCPHETYHMVGKTASILHIVIPKSENTVF